MRGALAVVLVGAFLLTACQVRPSAAPVGVASLEIGEPRRLTDRPALSPPAWAPDGRRLAYGDRQAVWRIALTGQERKVAPAGVVSQVEWSRAGVLAFVDKGQVWMVPAGGGPRRQVTVPAGEGTAASHLAWAPRGDLLAATLQAAVPARGRRTADQIWLLSADGAQRRLVFETASAEHVAAVQWFPDGLYLFIAVGDAGGEAGVTRLIRRRTRYLEQRIFPVPRRPLFDPSLSPDGRWVAFVSSDPSPAAAEHLWVVRLDGSGLRRLDAGAGRVTGVAWAPASDKVAVARVLDERRGQVWIADVSGPARRLVSDFVAEFPDPNLPLVVRWSPDGRHLAYGTDSGSYIGPIWVLRLERR